MTYVQLLEHENKIKLLQPFSGAKQHHDMKCLVCNYVWNATPLSKRQTFKKYGVGGCPNCNKKNKQQKYDTIRQDNIQHLKNRGIEVIDKNWDGRRHLNGGQYTLVTVKNIQCGHTFECSPANLLANNVECSVCGPKLRISKATAWSRLNSTKWQETATEWKKYKSLVANATIQLYKHNTSIINPNNYPRGLAGVEGAYHLDHIVPIRFCFDNNIPYNICASVDNLQMMAWKDNVQSRDSIKGAVPSHMLKYLSADCKIQQQANIIQSILPDSEKFVSIDDIVVTVYSKKHNLAITVISLDQSCANQKKQCVHILDVLSKNNIQSIILFEDELQDNTLLKSKLNHYSKNNSATRLHARKCIIKTCSLTEKRDLLEANHVQGNDNSVINYGAYYNDQLIAIMTFSSPRVAVGNKLSNTDGIWELSRFCTDVNYRIPGIASKLLKHFQNNHLWSQIYSFADRRWSVGNMYTQLGFTQTAINPPDYFYIIDGVRKHRWNYRKDILKNTLQNYDPTLTEYQNMENHGFWRIWGAGTLKFVITKN